MPREPERREPQHMADGVEELGRHHAVAQVTEFDHDHDVVDPSAHAGGGARAP